MARKHQKAHRVTAKGFTPTANPALARGMAQIAFSNAAGTHANRGTARKRTRATRLQAAIREYD